MTKETLELLTAIGSIGGGISGLMAIILFIYQARKTKETTHSTTYQEIVRMFDDFSRLMIENPKLAKIIYSSGPTKSGDVKVGLSECEGTQLDWLLAIRFDWFESVVVQKHRYNAIPPEVYDHWREVLKNELRSSTAMRQYWSYFGNYFHLDLKSLVADIDGELSREGLTDKTLVR